MTHEQQVEDIKRQLRDIPRKHDSIEEALECDAWKRCATQPLLDRIAEEARIKRFGALIQGQKP